MRRLYTFSLVALLAVAGEVHAKSAAERSSEVEVLGWPYVISVSDEFVDTGAYKKEGPYRIGFVTIFQANTWAVQFTHEFMDEAARHGDLISEVIHLDAQGEIPRQIAAVEDLIARGVDAIVIDPISPRALEGVFQLAKQRNIPVIAVSSQVPLEQVTAWVGRDDAEYGRVTALWLIEKLGESGNIIALSGIAGNPVAEERWRGAKEVFDQYPGIRVLTRQYADWGFAQAKATVANLLPAYPQIDGIWSGGGAMTQGAMEAFVDAGRPLVPMVGEANNGFLLDWIRYAERGFESIAFSNPTSHSAIGLRMALMALRGEPLPKEVHATAPYVLSLEQAQRYARPDLAEGYWVGHTLSEETVRELWGQ
ncbi:MAG: ABC transporter substrate-binding protein [Firmicutes bacterium]|nr:ABC transporter substrate-binding protein [Bacillota bacterium]